ncbi:MAG: helix-turn-helix transcriptional regulator [Actinomycetota bacterium]|nr:helix-turn-helix transcriptional regulator [Actinomycetota bacterium]
MPPTRTYLVDGAALKRRREDLRLSRAQLGRRIHRHPKAIANVEYGRRQPGRVFAEQLARALGLDPAQVIGQAGGGASGTAARVTSPGPAPRRGPDHGGRDRAGAPGAVRAAEGPGTRRPATRPDTLRKRVDTVCDRE